MGYYASGSGSITVKDEKAYDKIWELIKDGYSPFDDSWDAEVGSLTIEMEKYSENYHEDDIDDFLEKTIGLVTDGLFEFIGEDGCHWAFKYFSDTQKWEEISGRVIYDMSSFSDDELMKELVKRGYSVQYIG